MVNDYLLPEGLHIALSPNSCAAVCSYDRVESLQLRLLQYSESTSNEPPSNCTLLMLFVWKKLLT